MKLYDALRSDPELREEIDTLFGEERIRLLTQLEHAEATDLPALSAIKAQLDALKQVRFLFFKEEMNRGRPRQS